MGADYGGCGKDGRRDQMLVRNTVDVWLIAHLYFSSDDAVLPILKYRRESKCGTSAAALFAI